MAFVDTLVLIPPLFWSCGSPFSASLLTRSVVKRPLLFWGWGPPFSAVFFWSRGAFIFSRIFLELRRLHFQPLFSELRFSALAACSLQKHSPYVCYFLSFSESTKAKAPLGAKVSFFTVMKVAKSGIQQKSRTSKVQETVRRGLQYPMRKVKIDSGLEKFQVSGT